MSRSSKKGPFIDAKLQARTRNNKRTDSMIVRRRTTKRR